MVIQCITKRIGAAIHQDAEQHLPEGTQSDSRWNYDPIAVEK